MNPRRMGFRLKLVLGTNAVVLGVTLLTLAVVNMTVKQKVGAECASECTRATRVVDQYLSATREQLDKGVALLAGASDFQALVSTDGIDAETLLFSLKSFQDILKCDVLVLTDPSGAVRARTDREAKAGENLSSTLSALKDAIAGKPSGCLWQDSDRVIQTVVRPVQAGDQVVGCVIAGVQLGTKSAETLKGMLDREVVIVRAEKTLTSTVEGADASELSSLAAGSGMDQGEGADGSHLSHELGTADVEGESFQAIGVRLASGSGKDSGVDLFLLAPEERVLGFYHRTQTLLIGLGVTGQLLGFALAYVLATVVVVRPIRATVARLKDVAEGEGDLTKRIEVRSSDEIGQLGIWFNAFVAKLNDVILQVRCSASDVAQASAQIAAASQEMSHAAANAADQASLALSQSESAGKVAASGREVVERTVAEMQQINGSVSAGAERVCEFEKRGQDIGRFIEQINDIADQTNLLALNAAIEAARAGEQGRGFSVVADEVRKLASRTTGATEDITRSIESIRKEAGQATQSMTESTRRLGQGMSLATEAGESLERIVSDTRLVVGQVQSIAAAAQEVDATTRESVDAAARLDEKAHQLQDLVARFKVAESVK